MRGSLKVSLSATALALAASVFVYPWLPERMPVHFSLRGEPDGWASRGVGAFMLPACMLVFAVVLPRRVGNPAVGTTTALVNAFLLVLHVLVLRAALTGGPLGNGLWFFMGLFFALVGLVMPRVRMNRWVGLRTPWSLASPEAWARSQRVGGLCMTVAGLLIVLSAAWSGPAALTLRTLAIFGAGVFSIGYSYLATKTPS